MFARCPHCQTVFRVQAQVLGQAAGKVRCGECGQVFDALQSLFDTAEEAFAAGPAGEAGGGLAEVPAARPPEPPGFDVSLLAAPDDSDVFGQPPVAAAPRPPLSDVPAALLDDFTAGPAAARRWPARLAVLLLLAGLFLQGVYFARASLAQDPLWRPALTRACALLGCDLPLPRVPGEIELLEREVRDHPQVEGALLIRATLVNRAGFIQAYPLIGLQLFDVGGVEVAGRWFRPEAYLPPGSDPQAGLAPGVPLSIALEVVDPGGDVMSFQFQFR
ncbi:DUF3426 domain-containing protein [Thiohalobacter sp. IOR34]|uniref:DUF3426 domain-containing protein n=1 Tax=Thiohalobacter sp. IOR34 TaxID=3057176 RepID=UPI0025B110CC|nr:DUF3426 domain-containing protein [Thiohalobacter sp. IOR34]WJW75189.1 DUF3426 domain-containing protein [Thiohalobacter sp. IOR34]